MRIIRLIMLLIKRSFYIGVSLDYLDNKCPILKDFGEDLNVLVIE